jgi:radical SAM modification target selenobiotic family peptide
MDKHDVKKILAGISIAGLLAGVSTGCTPQKQEPAPSGTEAPAQPQKPAVPGKEAPAPGS